MIILCLLDVNRQPCANRLIILNVSADYIQYHMLMLCLQFLVLPQVGENERPALLDNKDVGGCVMNHSFQEHSLLWKVKT